MSPSRRQFEPGFHDNSLSVSDGQFADAVAAFLDDDDGPGKQLGARLVQHVLQAFDDVVRSRVVEAEQDDAYHLPG